MKDFREIRRWLVAGGFMLSLVALGGCHSPGHATKHGPPGVAQYLSPIKGATTDNDPYPSAKSVITDSKAVVEPRYHETKSPEKPVHNPWRFPKEWKRQMEE